MTKRSGHVVVKFPARPRLRAVTPQDRGATIIILPVVRIERAPAPVNTTTIIKRAKRR